MKNIFLKIGSFFKVVFDGIVEGRARRARLDLQYRMRHY